MGNSRRTVTFVEALAVESPLTAEHMYTPPFIDEPLKLRRSCPTGDEAVTSLSTAPEELRQVMVAGGKERTEQLRDTDCPSNTSTIAPVDTSGRTRRGGRGGESEGFVRGDGGWSHC